jgi:MtN3 and saliva related transmembrane protein
MSPVFVDGVAVAAAACSMTSFAPQVFKILRERDASAVSLRMYVVTVIGFALWTAYGWLLGQWPLIAANSISFMLAATVLFLKVRFSIRPPSG